MTTFPEPVQSKEERAYERYKAFCESVRATPMAFEPWVKFTFYKGDLKSELLVNSQENVFGRPLYGRGTAKKREQHG